MNSIDDSDMTNPRLQSGGDTTDSGLQSGETHLSHTDSAGRARMVDVGGKPEQIRIARAEGRITLQENTLRLIRENLLKKGDVLAIAEIAGIQAAKDTSRLIPLCHNINLSLVKVVCEPDETGVAVTSEVHCTGQTGVEMEALTAVNIALLTIYDMCKAVDKEMVMDSIHLIEKVKK